MAKNKRSNAFHSVTLISDLCKGCTNCIKRCPTEAIRVRRGKAEIITRRCIDCGECIRICPHFAKKALYDDLDILKSFKYAIALPAPSLYGQFQKAEDINDILSALLHIGFDDIFEVSAAAEIISGATAKYMNSENCQKPVISTACPTITRLIQIRFPNLIENILPLITPSELAAKLAKEQACEKTGLRPEEIGCIFISPCPAKVTSVSSSIGIPESYLDGAIAIKELYPLIFSILSKNNYARKRNLTTSGSVGVKWGFSGGEASATLKEGYLAADGIENCIRVLDALENGQLNAEFVELNACPGGCVGGVLTVENPFMATVKMESLINKLPKQINKFHHAEIPAYLIWSDSVDYHPVLELDGNISSAMEKMAEVDNIVSMLKGIDCGSCGAPSCRAFAEDIVTGHCNINDCVFVLRESMHNIAKKLADLSSWDNSK